MSLVSCVLGAYLRVCDLHDMFLVLFESFAMMGQGQRSLVDDLRERDGVGLEFLEECRGRFFWDLECGREQSVDRVE